MARARVTIGGYEGDITFDDELSRVEGDKVIVASVRRYVSGNPMVALTPEGPSFTGGYFDTPEAFHASVVDAVHYFGGKIESSDIANYVPAGGNMQVQQEGQGGER